MPATASRGCRTAREAPVDADQGRPREPEICGPLRALRASVGAGGRGAVRCPRARRLGRRACDPSVPFDDWAADAAGPEGPHVVADALERLRERREPARVEVLRRSALGSRGGGRCERPSASRGRCGVMWTSTTRRLSAGRSRRTKPGLLHAVDDAGEAALAEQDAARELVHPQPALRLLEMDERVVPAAA